MAHMINVINSIIQQIEKAISASSLNHYLALSVTDCKSVAYPPIQETEKSLHTPYIKIQILYM